MGEIRPKTQENLRSVFSRTGFTDGYLSGQRGEEMFGYRRKDDVVTADSQLLKELRLSYKDEAQRVAVSFRLTVKAGEKMTLSADDGERVVTVESEKVAEIAKNLPLSRERAEQSLRKTGNTPYQITEIITDLDGKAAVSAAALNALRREALDRLSERRAVWHDYRINEIDIEDHLDEGDDAELKDWICSKDLAIPKTCRDQQIFVALDGLSDDEQVKRMLDDGYAIGVEAPRVMFGNEREVYERLKRLRATGVSELLAHNIAAVYIGRELGYTVHAGFGMNLANSWSLKWAKNYGIADAEVSVELSEKQIDHLKKAIPVGMIRYGYLPLMICRNAPAGKNETCKTDQFLQDRKNEKFRVVTKESDTEIYNCVPILMPQREKEEKRRVFNIIRFSVENSVDNKEKILEKLRENRGFERFTHGLYTRGVKNFTIF